METNRVAINSRYCMYSYGRRRTLVPRVQLTPTSPWNGDTLRDSGGIECIAGFGPYQKATSVSSVTSTHSLPCSALLFSASSSFIFFFSTLTGKPSSSLRPRAGSRVTESEVGWAGSVWPREKPHHVMCSAFDMFSRETASFMKSALSSMLFFFILQFHCIYYFLLSNVQTCQW